MPTTVGLDSIQAKNIGLEDGSIVTYGGRYRIRTYDFHRVKMALYR